ncbi:hypothetical protein [Methanofollis fontis]|uniref:DUF5658 domain-containing protein n=1 Tax=Methanofollis fontis TaxID=2052832 RepID=A0A483CNR7_9EURY|nr:hypothetical protein [Methanofollis fontis]TAJ44640.1 hypothetical protein CUJ86_04860 [Methanofollis fontis]
MQGFTRSFRYRRSIALLALLLVADLATTRLVLATGGVELNPFTAPHTATLAGHLLYLAPLWGALFVAATGAAAWCDTRIPDSGLLVWVPICILYAVPVVHNLLVIWGLF